MRQKAAWPLLGKGFSFPPIWVEIPPGKAVYGGAAGEGRREGKRWASGTPVLLRLQGRVDSIWVCTWIIGKDLGGPSMTARWCLRDLQSGSKL